MNLWRAILLGVVQGVAEFLPISSSGHLAVLQKLFHVSAPGENDLFFDVVLHLGTLVAVLLVSRKDLASIVRSVPASISCAPTVCGTSFVVSRYTTCVAEYSR